VPATVPASTPSRYTCAVAPTRSPARRSAAAASSGLERTTAGTRVARGAVITLDELPPTLGGSSRDAEEPRIHNLLTLPLEHATREFERIVITRALIRAGGNKAEAARLLNIRRQHLYSKLTELGIDG